MSLIEVYFENKRIKEAAAAAAEAAAAAAAAQESGFSGKLLWFILKRLLIPAFFPEDVNLNIISDSKYLIFQSILRAAQTILLPCPIKSRGDSTNRQGLLARGEVE